MKPSMAKTSHFHWTTNKVTSHNITEDDPKSSSSKNTQNSTQVASNTPNPSSQKHDKLSVQRRKLQALTISRLRSVMTVFGRKNFPARVTGTLFGRRRGHVHFALQKDPTSDPSFLVELATPISGLVKEMASGLVRIALECDKTVAGIRLTEEVTWRAYCNGKRCGFASRRECGEKERKILKAVEMISMGAGVLPGGGEKKLGEGEDEEEEKEDEVMYMRAKFERVVGNRDSEAFYMMNPDCNGAPELSIYLLRI